MGCRPLNRPVNPLEIALAQLRRGADFAAILQLLRDTHGYRYWDDQNMAYAVKHERMWREAWEAGAPFREARRELEEEGLW